jgi:hypothetical protein
MPFSADAQVIVEQIDEETWKVLQAFSYTGKLGDKFTVPLGMLTDFASIPRAFVWFLPKYGKYTLAAILHDYLWRHAVPKGELPYVDADGLFRRAMRELGVPTVKRWMMWAAVRWAALGRTGGRKGWWREAENVVLVTVLSSPFLVPPAAVITAALLVMYVVELGNFGVQAVLHALTKTRRKPVKHPNKPRLLWKL